MLSELTDNAYMLREMSNLKVFNTFFAMNAVLYQ